MLIKKDKNEELEQILEQKEIDEQAKNILQGILYKIEASYKDYKKAKSKKETEEKYVEELLNNIDKKCNIIRIAKLSQKEEDKQIQKELEKNKFYVGEEIVSYPIEEKILYAIEKKSRYEKILNNKYGETTIALSEFINTGKNLDRVEILRDFNGWSWTTINKEIENIEANLIYQILQIELGEEFVNNWCKDKDGIIDYLEQFVEEITEKYDTNTNKKEISIIQKDLLIKIAMANTIQKNPQFSKKIKNKLKKINQEIEKYEDTETRITELTNYKKQLLKNKGNILGKLEKINYLLNPLNYIKEKEKLLEQKKKFEAVIIENQEQQRKWIIEFIKSFLECFKTLIQKTNKEEEIGELIYKFRYFILLPFSQEEYVKDIDELKENIIEIEKHLMKKAIDKKVIAEMPFEIMRHIFETRIIVLENLYYKITKENEKYYVQIFDENVTQEKFEIEIPEKTKIKKKIKIFS